MIEVLGAWGSRAKGKETTSFLITPKIAIDAGNLGRYETIEHVFLTHAHLDHVLDLPFFIERTFHLRRRPLTIYGTDETLRNLQKHLFNGDLWPDFSSITLPNGQNALVYEPITLHTPIVIDGVQIVPVEALHEPGSVGYIVDSNYITGDTGFGEHLWLNVQQYEIERIFIEVSFPKALQQLAHISNHLTPADIERLLPKLPKEVEIFYYHLKPSHFLQIQRELQKLPGEILFDGDRVDTRIHRLAQTPFEIVKAISYQKELSVTLEMIVSYAKELSGADGGTLYIKSDDGNYLAFKVLQNDSLGIYLKDEAIDWPPLPLWLEDGRPNEEMVAAVCALRGEVINLADVYESSRFNFEGTKRFDRMSGYRSKSMLVVPLKNHEAEIIGVLQLINKKVGDQVVPFDKEDEETILALAGAAAISLTKDRLIHDFERLFDSFIRTIGIAIDRKSKYTGGHVRKVAKLALLIARALKKEKRIDFDADTLKAIEIAGWLHDIGKITIPEYVMDKSRKLEGIFDRIELIKLRYLLFFALGKIDEKQMQAEIAFLEELNKGHEFVDDAALQRLEQIATRWVEVASQRIALIAPQELQALKIRRGTLLPAEYAKIQEHAKNGLEMLRQIYFPKKYRRIVDIAANHHEKLNAKGYPRGLGAKDLSLEERLMAIADIFEALSASDRPYKEPKKLSEIFRILYYMAKSGEIDRDIVAVFLKSGAYMEYAKEELRPEQIDTIDEEVKAYFLYNHS